MNFLRRLFSPPTAPEPASPASIAAETTLESAAVSVEDGPVEARPRPVPDGATRPLPPDPELPAANAEHLTFGQLTDVGTVRGNNQDAALSFFSTSRGMHDRPDFGLFVIADGMGGHLDGEKASAVTVQTVAQQIMSRIYLPMLAGDGEAQQIPIIEVLTEAVQSANAAVLAQVPDSGTTLTSVALIGNLAYLVHVGDSRVYIATQAGMEQVTRDHSLVQRLIELDQLTAEEAAEHPQKNVLYRALGQSDSLEVDTLTRRLPHRSRLLLCSDGLWNQVAEKVIHEVVMEHADPQEACDKLVALANEEGGIDNVTVILLHLPG